MKPLVGNFTCMAAAFIVQAEKRIKSNLFDHWFEIDATKQTEQSVEPVIAITTYLRSLKNKLLHIAMIACDSDLKISRSEFTLLTMKFSNHPIIKKYVEFLDMLVSKIYDFNETKSRIIDEESPFFGLISRFTSMEELVTGP